MKSAEDIKRYFQKASLSTNPDKHEAIFEKIQSAQDQLKVTAPTLSGSNLRSKIMKSPITKMAAVAVIIIAVSLGLFEFIDTGNTSGIVWAEVARKVEASRGHIVRGRGITSFLPDDGDYSIRYSCPKHSRRDIYKDGQIMTTFYSDLDTMTHTSVFHKHKRYISKPFTESEGFLERNEDWMNPRYIVQRILSSEHRKLGQKTIEGVLCEGLETTDPAVLDPLPSELKPVDRLMVHMRLWVDAETGYPVLYESTKALEAKGLAMVCADVMNQFQWDVELDMSLFEPNIPQDYVSR